MNYDRPELRQRLASEYVLGTLHGRARKRFQRLLKSDHKLRHTVEGWEHKLIPMASPLSVDAPSAKIWQGIAARVAPTSQTTAAVGFFERWFGWRSLGSLAAGIMIGITSALLLPAIRDASEGGVLSEAQLPESYVGFMQDDKGATTVLISSLRHGKIVDVKILRPIAVAPDQMLQLWAVPKDGQPFALGVIPANGKTRLTLAATSEQLLSKVSELAVSVEPRATSPAISPSGAFILRGPCAKLW